MGSLPMSPDANASTPKAIAIKAHRIRRQRTNKVLADMLADTRIKPYREAASA